LQTSEGNYYFYFVLFLYPLVMKKYFLAVLFLFMLMKSCSAQHSKTPDEKTTQEKATFVVLKLGENQFLEQQQMNITFVKVKKEEEYSADIAVVEVMGVYTRPRLLYLSKNPIPVKKYGNQAVFNGWKISLEKFSKKEIKLKITPETTSE
jgi:hypothetical protein